MSIEPTWKNEKAFTSSVKKAAKQFGWLVYHTHYSLGSEPGFPDLVLVHPEHGLVFAELKMPKGRLTEHQKHWKETLQAAGETWFLWRPESWDGILDFLQQGSFEIYGECW